MKRFYFYEKCRLMMAAKLKHVLNCITGFIFLFDLRYCRNVFTKTITTYGIEEKWLLQELFTLCEGTL